MCAFEISEYTDRPKPSLFLHATPSPDTDTDFLDTISRTQTEIETTTDPAQKKHLTTRLNAGIIATQQASLGNMVINSEITNNDAAATTYITAESDIEKLSNNALTTYAGVTAAANYASAVYGATLVPDDSDDDDIEMNDHDGSNVFSPLPPFRTSQW
jgi:hypothetical protein